jgi:hypothetical protein
VNSPSTTDGEFSSSLLSCPYNGISSSTSDLDRSHNHHQQQNPPPSSTVSALTTLTRKSVRRHQMKNVSFQPPLINSTNNTYSDLLQNTTSTFSTLPKQNKRDISITNKNQTSPILTDLPQTESDGFPTLQTILNQSIKDSQTKLPQPPPLLNGILLLDKMLTESSMSHNENNYIVSSSITNSEWYDIACDYRTRASIV